MPDCLYCAVNNHDMCSRTAKTVYLGGAANNTAYTRCACYRRSHQPRKRPASLAMRRMRKTGFVT